MTVWIVVLVAIILVFGGAGFAVHALWWFLLALVVIWLLSFFVGRRW